MYMLVSGYICFIIPNINTIVQLNEDHIIQYSVIKSLRDVGNWEVTVDREVANKSLTQDIYLLEYLYNLCILSDTASACCSGIHYSIITLIAFGLC